MTTTHTNLDIALSYAARGWHIVALHTPVPGGACSCGKPTCDSVGKHPRWDKQLLPNGLKSATADPGVIRVWWSLWPDANIGIVTGTASGLWALDVEAAGLMTLEHLLATHGPLPDTPHQQTGGGGAHYLFAHPGGAVRNRVRFAAGLDTRGDGGYIVAAPSLHASGARYDWIVSPDDAPLAAAPQWLLDLVTPAQSNAPPPTMNGASANGHAKLPRRTLEYLLNGAPHGARNQELYAAAQQFYAAGYSQSEADAKLRPRARADGLDDAEIDKAIGSAYQSVHVSGPAQAPGPGVGTGGTTTGAGSTPPRRGQHSNYIAAALASLGYAFRMNRCHDTIEVCGEPLTELIAARIRMDARDIGLKPLGAVTDTYMIEAGNNSYHPIQDYLNALVWDGQPRFVQFSGALRCADPDVVYGDGSSASLVHVYLWRWMIGAVAKVLDQKQNLMPVLSGPQGIGKSSLIRWLCPLPGYYLEGPINVADKDMEIRLISYWIWEVSEVDAVTRRSDVSALKDFITRDTVTVRKSYDRHATRKPALCSLIGTINESTGFLVDDTGNRRFLVARLSHIDWTTVTQIDRDQLWAEIVAAYRRGEPWELRGPELAAQITQNRTHEVENLYEDWVLTHFIVGAPAGAHRMTAGDIIAHLRRKDVHPTGTERYQTMELARALSRLGVVKIRTNSWRGYEGIIPL